MLTMLLFLQAAAYFSHSRKMLHKKSVMQCNITWHRSSFHFSRSTAREVANQLPSRASIHCRFGSSWNWDAIGNGIILL